MVAFGSTAVVPAGNTLLVPACAVGMSGRYKISPQSSIMVSYVQQLNKHDDPNFKLQPGLTIGLEVATSGHAFQLFITNFQGILPQENIAYNSNKFFGGGSGAVGGNNNPQFLIGFNITRLWNF